MDSSHISWQFEGGPRTIYASDVDLQPKQSIVKAALCLNYISRSKKTKLLVLPC